ncbi:MAG: serine/threonine-protein kinase [Planctomycetota bacterium]
MDMLLREGIVDPPESPACLYRIGTYRVTSVLGEGSMGVVVEAEKQYSDAVDRERLPSIALKVLRPQLMDRPALVYQFLAEARRVMAMSHSNIVKVIEVRERDAGPYFVMPVYTGGGLDRRLGAERKPPDRDDTLKWATQIATGMAHAHSRGLLHRDLKPSNILLDGNGDAAVADFGLFRSLADSIVDPKHSKVVGTYAYLSPAAAAGESEDVRGDIYGFGALLYEILTGRTPYDGKDADTILDQIKAGPPVRIRELVGEADPDLCYVAEKAMARDPAERYGSFNQVVEDLNAIKDGHALPSLAGSHQGPKSRGRGLALFLVAILALAIGAVWFLREDPKDGDRPVALDLSPIDFGEDTLLHHARVLEASLPLAQDKEFDLSASLLTWHTDGGMRDSTWEKTCAVPWGTEGQSRLAVVEDGKILLIDPTGWGSRVIYDRFLAGYPIDMYSIPTQTGRFETTFAATGLTGRGPCCVLFDDEANVRHEFLFPDHSVTVPGTEQLQHRQIWNPTISDLDQDGEPELLLGVYDGYQAAFRGLVCIDIATGQQRWRRPLPNHLNSPQLVEYEGGQIIIVGSYAPANGFEVGGWSDEIGRAWAIGADGKPIWHCDVNDLLVENFPEAVRREGENAKYTRIEMASADLDGDGEDELYAMIAGNKHHQRGIGLILQIDPQTGTTLGAEQRHVHGALVMSKVPSPDHAGDAFLVTDVLGQVHLFGGGLAELHSTRLLGLEHDSAALVWAGSVAFVGQSSRTHVFLAREESLAGESDRTPRDLTPNDVEEVTGCQLIITDDRLEVISRVHLAEQLPLGASFDCWVWGSERGDRVVVQIDGATLLLDVE